jgi:hypothetical protein
MSCHWNLSSHSLRRMSQFKSYPRLCLFTSQRASRGVNPFPKRGLKKKMLGFFPLL